MKNPFMKEPELMGGRREKMIERAERWKPVARTHRPKYEDFPILIWRSENRRWEIWDDPRRSDQLAHPDTAPFVWFSLPKE
jgi:hypothetical protein